MISVLGLIFSVVLSGAARHERQTPAMTQYITLLLNCPVVIAVILVSGIGGTFQYGYGISVMTSPSAFLKKLMNRTCVQRYNVSLEQWQVSLIWSFTVSIFSIGGLLGALSSGQLLSKFGRKKCLFFNNFVAIFGALLMITSKTAVSYEMVMAGRFLYGINAGVCLTTHPMYVVECSSKRLRGMVGVSVATFVSLGKFCGQLFGISELLGTEDNWPWLLGFNGFTALFQLLALPFLPESPSFLLMDRGDRPACERALKRLWGDGDHSREVEEMLEEKAALQGVRSHSVLELLQSRAVRWQLLSIVATFITLQLSGINAVYFYSFEVFQAAGIPPEKLSYAALGTGLCEVSVSVACFIIVERTGKRVLLVRGYAGMSASLILLTVTLYLQRNFIWMSYCSMALIFVFICFFSCGPAGVTAPLPGQIFTQSFKAAAYTVACTINWAGLFTVGMLFPVLVEHLGSFCFLIFLFFCVTCGVFVCLNVPETKNRSALEIAAEFDRMHSKSGAADKQTSSEQKLGGTETHETKF